MSIRVRNRAWAREDGAAAVEFALVMPILLMILFGIISFGIMLAQNMALNNGAREGARFGVVDGKTCAAITTAAKDASVSVNMRSADVTVTIKRGQTAAAAQAAASPCTSSTVKPCAGSVSGDSLFVTTEFTSKVLVPVPGIADSLALDGVGVFRCEFS